ncbi:MAG: hypothetical protein JO057_20060, partial [Chloroflexi bacterium]|nr:hypothetical protein [Chloroflexota bacterium]
RARVLTLAAFTHLPDLQPAESLDSVRKLEGLLEALSQTIARDVAARARATADDTLRRVMRLRHLDRVNFEPLLGCQAQADVLLQHVASLDSVELPDEVKQLAAGNHPLANLVELAHQQANLDDARWETLRAAISHAFGVSLAAAAARGRLTAADAPPLDTSSDPDNVEEDQLATLTLQVAVDPTTAGGPSPRLEAARELVSSTGTDQTTSASALTTATDQSLWQAVARGMPAVGYHLGGAAPGLAESAGLPGWLLRALSFSPWVRYPNGDLALALQADLARFVAAPSLAPGDGGEALRLLYVAAALRPALVAPETGAWSVLRAVVGQLPWPHLERFASTVAEYGERHRPLTPLPNQPFSGVEAWRDTMEDLLREIGSWRVRMLGMQASFAPANAVWRRWMQPDGLVHGLIAPLGLEPHLLEQTLGRVERLSNTPQIRWEIAATDREALGRVDGPAINTRTEAVAELVEGVNQAVAFARAWAALQEARPGREDDPSVRESAEVRRTLSALLGPVREEIMRARQEHTAVALVAALDRLASAVDSVAELLGASERHVPWPPPREPSPLMLLNAPLLRVPTALLDPAWNVEWVPADIASRLAGLAETVKPDWTEAFAERLRQGDHQAAAQILTYLQGGIETPQAVDVGALRADFDVDLERWERRLVEDVERSRHEIDLAAAKGALTAAERGRLQAVVESIDARPASGHRRFGPAVDRLADVRRTLARSPDRQHTANAVEAPSRTSIKDALASPDGPCLLVGRPGFGRRALLEDLARSCTIDGDRQAVLIEVKREPAIDVAGERFWIALEDGLRSHLGLPSLDAPSAASATRQQLHGWLATNPGRRLLILVDESDALLQAERQIAVGGSSDPFPISQQLAELMDDSHRRVKVVLAGWLEVQRATSLPDHPLGTRGCRWLGPLLDHGEWQQAGLVARELLQHAGAAEPSAAQTARLLSLANYEPELLARLTDKVAQQARETDGSGSHLDHMLRALLPDEARSLDTRHTALVDRRFDVVLKLVAIGCRGGTSSISQEQLRRQAMDWWADGFRETWTDDAFRDLIDDMVGLRLLRRIGHGQLALHSPNLLSDLGSADELIAELTDYLGQPASPDIELDPRRDARSSCASAPASLGVLTARQRAMLARSHARVSVVFGTDMAELPSVSSCLDDGSRRLVVLDPRDRSENSLRQLMAAQLRETPSEPTWLLLSGLWPLVTPSLLQDALGPYPTARAVLLANPAQTWQLITALAETSAVTLSEWLEGAGVDSYTVGPWP